MHMQMSGFVQPLLIRQENCIQLQGGGRVHTTKERLVSARSQRKRVFGPRGLLAARRMMPYLLPACDKFIVSPVMIERSEAILAMKLKHSRHVSFHRACFQRCKRHFEQSGAFICAACHARIPTGCHRQACDSACRSGNIVQSLMQCS